jgi:hypothetical protein
MKTLKEHEYENRNYYRLEPSGLAIACDHCGSELFNPTPGISYTTDPPKIAVQCSNTECGFKGYMTV